MKRTISCSNSNREYKSKILISGWSLQGYKVVTLSKEKIRTVNNVHILVAEAFCEKIDKTYNVAIHLDSDRKNNNFNNLKWSNQKVKDKDAIEGERWRTVAGYEGIYEVSDHGRIMSLDRTVDHNIKKGTKRNIRSKMVHLSVSSRGYLFVKLLKDQVTLNTSVHRLVATAFCERGDGHIEVNHLDADKKNNHYTNLQWSTKKENMNHAFDNDLMNKNTKVVLTDLDDMMEIKFRSMIKASNFLERNNGYISYLCKACTKIASNKGETKRYKLKKI